MQLLIESLTPVLTDYVEEFIDFMCGTLGVIERPQVDFVPRTGNASFGHYQPSEGSIVVATEGRHIADTLRTLGHEIVHHKQMEAGEIDTLPLLDLERDANAVVGLAMRDYNKLHPELYGAEDTLPDDQLDQEGESQGAVDSDTTRPSGPINMVELSNRTLASYKTKALQARKAGMRKFWHGEHGPEGWTFPNSGKEYPEAPKRKKGIESATEKLTTRYAHLNDLDEEMTAGAGDVAGIGIGSQGEPGIPVKKKKTLKMFRRKLMEYNDKARTVNDTDAKKRLAQARTIFGKAQKK